MGSIDGDDLEDGDSGEKGSGDLVGMGGSGGVPGAGSLVLYKQAPALVVSVGEKIEICLPGGKGRSVREKDVCVLHPGPVPEFPDLESGWDEGAREGAASVAAEEAWELLQGEGSTSLQELAELVYGEFSPGSAWMAFRLLNRTPWFRGTPGAVEIVDAESVRVRVEADRRKAEAEQAWEDFLGRFEKGQVDRVEDELFLRDLELLALGKNKGSRILKHLKKAQTPENAHRMMVAKGVVEGFWNPHPLRLDVPLDEPVPGLDADGADGVDKAGALAGRLDLRSVEAFAIDDEGNTDPDDAVAWDGERFWVHVADVAGAVPAGSKADSMARERASSLYLPEKTVPMLPQEAVRRFGLGLNDPSPALSYAFGFDAEWNITDFSIHLTSVRVTRISYGQAEQRLEEEPFATIKQITDAFRRRREAAGAISITMPEVKIEVGDGGTIQIHRLGHDAARNLVGESMLMAGACAASWCREQSVPVPYAVQDLPEGHVSGNAGNEGQGLTGFAAEFARRKGMKRSRTTLVPGLHAGLGLECYSRVTSPLRRYPDLLASRQIRNTLLGKATEDADSVLEALAACESRTGSLVQAERRSVLFWKLQWLAGHKGYRTGAVLLDTREKQGIFLVPQLALEVKVALPEPMKPGQEATLILKSVDIPELTAVFKVAGRS